MKGLAAVVLASLVVLAGCSGSSTAPPIVGGLAGNWQFALQKTTTPRTTTLLSGFLQQTGKAVTGAVELTPPLASAPPCGGSFQVTGTNDGQNVTLTVNEGGATVSLTGTGGASTMGGTYSLVASGCGKDESGTWTATLVKPLTGTFTGVLHSMDSSGLLPVIQGSDFAVTGQLLQSGNIGATRATLTGTLSVPNLNYPCFTDATLSGSITGTSVQLNIVGTNGVVLGTIGSGTIGTKPVTAKADGSGFSSFSGTGYQVNKASGCSSQERGNVCVDIGSATSCKQPLAYSLSVAAFNPVLVGTSSTPQTVTLTNQSSLDLDLTGLSVQGLDTSDFVVDTSGCPATLPAQTSCPIVVTFTPTASCPPFLPGTSEPRICPLPRTAAVSIPGPSGDPDSPHTLQLSGLGMDAIIPDAIDLNFGVVPAGTISPPLTVTFVNQGPVPVTISGLTIGWSDSGTGVSFAPCGTGSGTPLLACDFVMKFSSSGPLNCAPPPSLRDSCTGQSIAPLASCKVDIVYCPLNTTSGQPIIEGIQIVTDEHNASGPTADSTRVPVQLDGTAN